MIFCKMGTCEWNVWNALHKKHVCDKYHIHLDKDGACGLAPTPSGTHTNAEEEEKSEKITFL